MAEGSGERAPSWYLPHRLVALTARILDRRAGRGGRRRGAYTKALRRLDTGRWSDDDVFTLVGLVVRIWPAVIATPFIATLACIGLDALLEGAVPTWIFAMFGALMVGGASFAFVFYLHLFAYQRRWADPEDNDWLVRHFAVPRRINLLVVPVGAAICFVLLLLDPT